MAHKTMVGGTAYEISGGKALVDGTAYSIKGGKTLVDGTAYEIGFGPKIGDLPVGSSVYMNVDGISTEFLVVHQGNPDSNIYDSSCDGTWLLMKDLYVRQAWDDSDRNRYVDSDIHTYLNDTFLGLLDSDIQSAIKQVKIPYTSGNGLDGSIIAGSRGLSTKIFLLSYTEVGFSGSPYAKVEGSVLSYFNGAADSKRVAKLNSSSIEWWLRTPSMNIYYVWWVSRTGTSSYTNSTTSLGVRPAFILPSSTKYDENFSIIA